MVPGPLEQEAYFVTLKYASLDEFDGFGEFGDSGDFVARAVAVVFEDAVQAFVAVVVVAAVDAVPVVVLVVDESVAAAVDGVALCADFDECVPGAVVGVGVVVG